MNKRIAAIVIATGLITTMSTLVFAEPLSDTLKKQQDTMKQKQDSLQGVQNKRQQLERDIESLDIQIEGLLRKIADNNNKIYKTQSDIKAAEKDLAKSEADLKEEQDFFDQRMKAMYVSGNEGYLEILLDSNGVNDFFEKLEGVKKVVELNKKVVNELNDKKKEITVKKKSLDDENAKLLAFKADNEKKLVVLNENKTSQNKLVAQYKAQEKLDSAELNKSKALVDETRKKIEELAKQQQATISTPSRGGVAGPISTDALIVYATSKKFIGTAYKWGGTGPLYDCSGFVQAVYAHFGVYLPRTTYDQVRCGTAVTGDLKAGDLLFFHPGPNGPEHVGMYVGGNCFVHAPQTGDVIKISALGSRSDLVAVRRIR